MTERELRELEEEIVRDHGIFHRTYNDDKYLANWTRTYLSAIIAEVRMQRAEIKRLREERRWIPVPERLPEPWVTVLTNNAFGDCPTVGTGYLVPASEMKTGEPAWCLHCGYDPPEVTAWMPLPEPEAKPC